MTLHYEAATVSQVLPIILSDLIEYGNEVGSRNGRVKEILNPQIVIQNPVCREVLSLNRKANVFAQIAETMWVLAGRNDVEWLSAYLPRAKDYSDDGKVWRGGYGPRIRGGHFGFDQLEHVIDILKDDPLSRRAVIAIYEPITDASPGKDIPCNDFLQFQSRGGALHMTVTVRSNDVMWGWSGINTFEWSTLQEIIASILGIRVGPLVFNIGSLHLYGQHWEKARHIEYEDIQYPVIPFDPDRNVTSLHDVDQMLERFFIWEARCRANDVSPPDPGVWPSPLFEAWAAAIAYYWTRDNGWLDPIFGTALGVAIARTPASVLSEAPQTSRSVGVVAGHNLQAHERVRAFYEYTKDLHAVKHASYGNSWKKRGEKMSILANIARKVDRLGISDQYESSSDTVIDLLVYLIKYECWLQGLNDDPVHVNTALARHLAATEEMSTASEPLDLAFAEAAQDFDYYADNLDALSVAQKCQFVENLIDHLAPIARDLWCAEQDVDEYRGADAD